MNDRKYIFILGTGRTGTVFLKDFLGTHIERCLAVHEPNRMTKIMSNMYLSGRLTKARMLAHLRRLRKSIDHQLEEQDTDVYVQSDAWLIGFCGVLAEVFPEAYVAHSVRHPMTYIPSFLNRYYRGSFEGLARDLIPYWKLRGSKTGDYSSKEWKSLSLEEQMAWHWVKHNSVIENCKESFGHYKLLRYEDMYDENKSGLKDLIEFCQLSLEFEPDVIKAAGEKKNAMNKKFLNADEWSPGIMEGVENICFDHMDRYGYTWPIE